MNVEQETLGFRRGSLSLPLSLLMSAFALLIPPASLTRHLRRLTERSPTACTKCTPASSVYSLSPVTSSAQDDSPSELFRFLSRVAASKPPSWLSMPSPLVFHSTILWDLRRRSGLFPS